MKANIGTTQGKEKEVIKVDLEHCIEFQALLWIMLHQVQQFWHTLIQLSPMF